jgi:MFS family permease
MLAILSTVRHLDKDVRREPAPVRTRLRLDRDIALLFGITMLGGLAYRGVTTMLPSYATIMFGKNTLEAGSMVTIMLAAGGVSQVVAGEIHDRFGARLPLP